MARIMLNYIGVIIFVNFNFDVYVNFLIGKLRILDLLMGGIHLGWLLESIIDYIDIMLSEHESYD